MLSERQLFYLYMALTDRYGFRLVLASFCFTTDFHLIFDRYFKDNYIIFEWDFDILYTPDYQLINWLLDAYGFEIFVADNRRKRLRRKQ